ncbi:MAG TPA: DEAD/DEAH box helicase, partial [Elusimicrobiota bacterium]|nr:DEAD/DEAH box helicase [Elusimicrobiota bacterium]
MRISGVPGAGAWSYLARAVLALPRPPRFPPSSQALDAFGPGPVGRLVVVRGEEEALEDVADGVRALAPLFGGEPIEEAFFGEDPQARLRALERLERGARLVLATPEALAGLVPDAGEFRDSRLHLRAGAGPGRQALLDALAERGYRRVDFVESPGEFAGRGAVVDLFPIEPPQALRVLYDDDRIGSIRAFDPQTQAGLPGLLDEAVVPPVKEAEGGVPLVRRLAEAAWLVEEGCPGAPEGAVRVGLGSEGETGVDAGFRGAPAASGVEDFARRAAAWAGEGTTTLLFSMNRGEDERMQELLEGRVPPGAVQFLVGRLPQGFLLPAAKLAAASSAEILGRSYRPWRGAVWRGGGKPARLGTLKKGDYVVHELYGVARYRGMETIRESFGLDEEGRPTGSAMDCLRLEFRGNDALFVPMSEFRLVQKFVGSEGHRPRLSSLDARSWEEVQGRVREGVRELAAELLRLQAERAARPGHAFPPESHLETEFADSFPYEETPDQARAIAEVKADMERPRPMDRVVVGDVGFGKTEVAMRAALKCVSGFKQAALLVPTTILAEQHLRTFRRRLAGYPVRVEALSRFVPKSAARAILRDLAAGKVDVVIGTHRLLQPDVRFKDLGLVVVDEEHRFGVKDKERLKALRSEVDFLALSATPIPRTLHQALTGLRGVSMIQSAPAGR